MRITVALALLCTAGWFQLGEAGNLSAVVPLHDGANSMDVYFGNERQQKACLMDTGSADCWAVFPSIFHCSNDDLKHIKYGSGSVDVRKCPNSVYFGTDPQNGTNGVSADLIMGIAEHNIPILENIDINCICGLAFPVLSKTKIDPFWMQLMDANLLQDDSFTFVRSSPFNEDGSGKCKFGAFVLGKQPVEYCGDMHYTAVTKESYWNADKLKVTVNGDDSLCKDDGCAFITDSGTNDVKGDKETMDELNGKIGAKWDGHHYVLDCAGVDSLPNVSFHVTQDYTITLSPKVYISKVGSECRTHFTVLNLHLSGGKRQIVLGLKAMQMACVQFRRDGRIGFADVKELSADDPNCPKNPDDDDDDDDDDDSSE